MLDILRALLSLSTCRSILNGLSLLLFTSCELLVSQPVLYQQAIVALLSTPSKELRMKAPARFDSSSHPAIPQRFSRVRASVEYLSYSYNYLYNLSLVYILV
jgi:hypothetical protein